jgi:hypothetical protein
MDGERANPDVTISTARHEATFRGKVVKDVFYDIRCDAHRVRFADGTMMVVDRYLSEDEEFARSYQDALAPKFQIKMATGMVVNNPRTVAKVTTIEPEPKLAPRIRKRLWRRKATTRTMVISRQGFGGYRTDRLSALTI